LRLCAFASLRAIHRHSAAKIAAPHAGQKMQHELKAPKAGRVAALSAKEGATVAAGEVLAVVE
jgi:acetyl/propionyl-CoA carboxylase alpha subunit